MLLISSQPVSWALAPAFCTANIQIYFLKSTLITSSTKILILKDLICQKHLRHMFVHQQNVFFPTFNSIYIFSILRVVWSEYFLGYIGIGHQELKCASALCVLVTIVSHISKYWMVGVYELSVSTTAQVSKKRGQVTIQYSKLNFGRIKC